MTSRSLKDIGYDVSLVFSDRTFSCCKKQINMPWRKKKYASFRGVQLQFTIFRVCFYSMIGSPVAMPDTEFESYRSLPTWDMIRQAF